MDHADQMQSTKLHRKFISEESRNVKFSEDMLVHDIHRGVTNVAVEDPPAVSTTKHTSFLLLQCQFVPINFHSISQLHP